MVSSIFNEPLIAFLKGNVGIGHTRYSTTGGSENVQLAQPFIVHTSYGAIAVAHNGELVNSQTLRQKILDKGVGLSTGSDSELITQCLSMKPPERFRKAFDHKSKTINGNITMNGNGTIDDVIHLEPKNNDSPPETPISEEEKPLSRKTKKQLTSEEKEIELVSRLLHLMSITPLSYSLLVMYDECLYALRDPFGNRPLCIGMLYTAQDSGPRASQEKLALDGWVVSSESCSFPSVSAKVWRDIEPGEIVKLERNKLPRTIAIVPRPDNGRQTPAFCIFEHVYFARPDSIFDGQQVYHVREKCGMQLAKEACIPIPADPVLRQQIIVAPVPESSIPAALGFAKESGLSFVEVFSRNRYVGRTFIQPSTRLRRLGVARKFGPLSTNFKGKTIILIDDSIVRGTTIGQLVKLLKDFGAKDVHIRIASPPLHYPCYMGINIPTREELIANHKTPEQLAETLGASSLVHLSVDGLREAVESGIRSYRTANGSDKPIGHCMACLTGDYPVNLDF